MARAGSWKLIKYSQNPGGPRPQLTGTVCPAPPVFSNRYMYFSFFLRLGNSESWKVETAITLPVLHVCTFPARERPSQRCKAPGAQGRRAQRLGQSARRCSARRGRLGIASEHARILAAPAVARRIESRAALRRRRHLLSCDGCVMAVSADMLHRHFRTIGFALD